MHTPLWKLTLLGRFDLEHAGTVVDRFGSRLDEQLLAMLALHTPAAVSRSELAASLWPHMDEIRARKQISYYLFQLRRRLRDCGLAKCPEDIRGSFRLSQDVVVDALAFLELLAQVVRNPEESRQTRLLDAAIAMYGAGLLPQISAAWLVPHQERFAHLYRIAVEASADREGRAAHLGGLASLLPSVAWQGGEVPADARGPAFSPASTDLREDLLQYTEAAGIGLATDARSSWFESLRLRMPQIQDAVTKAVSEDRLAEAAGLLGPIWRFWQVNGIPAAGTALLQPVLDAGYVPVGEAGAKFLHALGTLGAFAGQLTEAQPHLREAIRLWDDLAKPQEGLRSRANLGIAYFQHGDFRKALDVFADCLSLARALGDDELQIRLYLDAARSAIRCHDAPGARRYLDRRRRLLDANPTVRSLDIAQNWVHSASVSLLEGAYPQALEEVLHAQSIFRELQNPDGLVLVAQVLGRIAYWNGRLAEARTYMEEAVTQARLLGSPWLTGLSLGYLATVIQAQGESEAASEILADAELLLETIPDSGALERARVEVEQLRSQGAHMAPPG